jgi:hypothetical protein
MDPMPRVPPLDRPATYDDLLKVPEIQVAEIVDGELYASPRPAPRHARAGAAWLDRAKKLAIYARERVTHTWLIDPDERTLEVLRLESGRWVIAAKHTGTHVVRAEPYDGMELDLGWLWADVEA